MNGEGISGQLYRLIQDHVVKRPLNGVYVCVLLRRPAHYDRQTCMHLDLLSNINKLRRDQIRRLQLGEQAGESTAILRVRKQGVVSQLVDPYDHRF